MYSSAPYCCWPRSSVRPASAPCAEWQRACVQPSLALRDGAGAVMLLLRLLVAGSLFGFGLAMLLDRWLGGWGILLAAVLCTAAAVVLYLRLTPQVQEERP